MLEMKADTFLMAEPGSPIHQFTRTSTHFRTHRGATGEDAAGTPGHYKAASTAEYSAGSAVVEPNMLAGVDIPAVSEAEAGVVCELGRGPAGGIELGRDRRAARLAEHRSAAAFCARTPVGIDGLSDRATVQPTGWAGRPYL